jgi:hypothetical protein
VKQACKTCGTPSAGRYCPAHQPTRVKDPTSWNGQRSRKAQHQFRMAVLEAANYHCECGSPRLGHCGLTHRTPCGMAYGLQAHHTRPGNDDPNTGVCLCQACHRRHDRWAR